MRDRRSSADSLDLVAFTSEARERRKSTFGKKRGLITCSNAADVAHQSFLYDS